MNYFELFEIPVTILVDKKLIGKKYFALQKKYHPDYFGAGTQQEKEEALETSSHINKAYKTFQSTEATIKYVLQQKGLLEEEEKFTLPPDFLAEVLELNEMKMDDASPAEIDQRAQQLQREIYAEVADLIEDYSDASITNDELLRLKTYYYKKKYIDRLLAE
jgi:molecular chaperone HscB